MCCYTLQVLWDSDGFFCMLFIFNFCHLSTAHLPEVLFSMWTVLYSSAHKKRVLCISNQIMCFMGISVHTLEPSLWHGDYHVLYIFSDLYSLCLVYCTAVFRVCVCVYSLLVKVTRRLLSNGIKKFWRAQRVRQDKKYKGGTFPAFLPAAMSICSCTSICLVAWWLQIVKRLSLSMAVSIRRDDLMHLLVCAPVHISCFLMKRHCVGSLLT